MILRPFQQYNMYFSHRVISKGCVQRKERFPPPEDPKPGTAASAGQCLALRAPIRTAADGIYKYFFLCFSEKIRLVVSSESSARQRIHMKNQALFSSKDKSKQLKCRLLQFSFGALRVNLLSCQGSIAARMDGWMTCQFTSFSKPGRVAQSVGHLTRTSGVLGSIPGLATYFRFSFRFFKKGSCQLLAKVCARSTG